MLTANNLEEKYFKNIRKDLSNQTGGVNAIEEKETAVDDLKIYISYRETHSKVQRSED